MEKSSDQGKMMSVEGSEFEIPVVEEVALATDEIVADLALETNDATLGATYYAASGGNNC